MAEPKLPRNSLRVLRVLKLLKGHTLDGLSHKHIVEALGESPSAVTYALQALIAEGLVTKLESGHFAHSITLLQIAQAHADHTARMQARISEINARIATGALA